MGMEEQRSERGMLWQKIGSDIRTVRIRELDRRKCAIHGIFCTKEGGTDSLGFKGFVAVLIDRWLSHIWRSGGTDEC